VPLVEVVVVVLFAPFRCNIVFTTPFALVATLDPNVFATIWIKPVIAWRDDIAFTGRQLLIHRRRGRNIDVDTEICCTDDKWAGQRACNGNR